MGCSRNSRLIWFCDTLLGFSYHIILAILVLNDTAKLITSWLLAHHLVNVDSSILMIINAWYIMLALEFQAAIGVNKLKELGADDLRGAENCMGLKHIDKATVANWCEELPSIMLWDNTFSSALSLHITELTQQYLKERAKSIEKNYVNVALIENILQLPIVTLEPYQVHFLSSMNVLSLVDALEIVGFIVAATVEDGYLIYVVSKDKIPSHQTSSILPKTNLPLPLVRKFKSNIKVARYGKWLADCYGWKRLAATLLDIKVVLIIVSENSFREKPVRIVKWDTRLACPIELCLKLFSPIFMVCIQCQARADLILVLAGYFKKVAGINFLGNLKWYEVVGRWNTAIRIIVAYLRIVEIAIGPHHHITFQLFKVEHSPSLPLVIILKTWTSMGGNSQVTQILELLGHLSIVTSMWANSVGELEMQAVAFSDFPDGFRLQSAQGLGADMYTFKSEDMQQQVMGAMNMHVGEVVEFFFKAGHDTKQLAEILSANCSLQFKQWDPGGYSLVHKQGSRDLEAIYQYATITHQYYLDFNLEDKVGFKGEGNVMNRLMSQHNVVPILNLKGWKMGKWRHI